MRSHRNILLLWVGQVISQAGDSIYQIAVIWLLLQMTGRGTITGIGAMSAYLPVLIFGIMGGIISDIFDRRKVMIFADGVRAVLVLTIPLLWFTGNLTPFYLMLITFLTGCFATIFNPARDSIVPDIAPEGKLELANSLIQTSWQLAMFIGPAFAGLLIPITGIYHLFEVDSLTFLISLICILFISSGAGKISVPFTRDINHTKTKAKFIWQLKDGISYTWKDRRLRFLMTITFFYNLLLMGIPLVATPIFVKKVLDNRPETFAWLQAVYAGGMLVGAPLAVYLSKKVKKGSLLLIGIILDGLSFCPLAIVSSNATAFFLMWLHSIVIPIIVVPRTTLLQQIVPRNLWGRVFAILSVAVTGSSSLSSIIVGAACDFMDVRMVIVLFGCLSAGTGVIGFLLPDLRKSDG